MKANTPIIGVGHDFNRVASNIPLRAGCRFNVDGGDIVVRSTIRAIAARSCDNEAFAERAACQT
ncbi:hypothetical protein [Antricoccus suffuscus]|uniref:hypothetical protein n=1 Tax=Antricoccus suffuscus TaxID=1629062 RepID=UPI0011B27FD1|nr:hypothetical protein [Antricoccus suffuscus]